VLDLPLAVALRLGADGRWPRRGRETVVLMAVALSRLDTPRLVRSLVIAAALVGLWFAFTRGVSGETGQGPKDPAIETISPRPDELVLRQTQVVVDLAAGYRGDLFVDGQQIPVVDAVNDDSPGGEFGRADAVFDPALNTITFTPREGATIEELTTGTHQIIVKYWKLDESAESARNYTWSFRVQG
jgi:hypothetical protein